MTSRAAADIELLNRYLQGDVSAFDELVRAHEDRVFGICLRMMRDRDAALDAVQETFVTVFRKADRYEAKAAFSTWLYRVAVNTCYDQLRKAKRRRTEPLPETSDPVDPSSADLINAAELRPDIEQALQARSGQFVFQWVGQHGNTVCIPYPLDNLRQFRPVLFYITGFSITHVFLECGMHGIRLADVNQMLGEMRAANVATNR